MQKSMPKSVREKPIPELKVKAVERIINLIKNNRTILIVSTKSLPASQFQKIKTRLRDKTEIVIAKKSIVQRAISYIEKSTLQNLKSYITTDIALIFSSMEPFELASLLVDYQSPIKAKVGDIAPEDIHIEPGPTELIPGPAISELGAVGLKVAVEGGKLAIKEGKTIVKKGEIINEKVANVLSKLKIEPIKVGFIPLAAYDAKENFIYTEIKIDKGRAFESLKESIAKALSFAVHIKYIAKETILYFIGKATMEEKAIGKIIAEKQGEQ